MSVQTGLKRMRGIWVKIMKRPDRVEVTGYDEYGLEWMLECLEKAIKRYEGEARRVRKYYRGPRV